MAESYSIGSTDLSTLLRIQRVDAQGTAPVMLQTDYLVPGRVGAVPTKPWFGPSVVMIGGIVEAPTRPAYLQKLHSLMSLCVNSGLPFTMKRVLPFPTGSRTNVATARYLGGLDFVDQVSPRIGRVMIEFSILSGFWSDENFTSAQPRSGAFAVQGSGDAATSDVRVTFSGGTNQRLTNTTTGDWVQFTGSASAHPVVLGVRAFTAVQNSVNVVDKVTANLGNTTPYWMTVRPGPNEFTLTGGGTVDVQFKGLYV